MSEKACFVKVRPFNREDLKKMILWNNDPEVERFVDRGLPRDLEECELWLEQMKKNREYRLFAIEDENERLIGDLELDHICWRRREAELRIRIGEKEYWNKGYGTLALQQIITYVFGDLGLNLLYLRVYAFNSRAIQCYERIGFKKQAALKRPKDQGWKEIYLMSIQNPQGETLD